MMLQKEANFDLDRLLGYEERSKTVSPRDDMWASLAALTPRTVRAAMVGTVGLGVLLAVESGLTAPFVASLLAAVALHYIGQLDSAEPVEEYTVTKREGLSEHQVWRYLTLHDEHESLKKDKQESELREARAKSGGSNPGGSANRGRSRGGR